MTIARAKRRAVSPATAASAAPSRRWTCQSSGRWMTREFKGDFAGRRRKDYTHRVNGAILAGLDGGGISEPREGSAIPRFPGGKTPREPIGSTVLADEG